MIRAFLIVAVLMAWVWTLVGAVALPVVLVVALVRRRQGSDLASWRWLVPWMRALAVLMVLLALALLVVAGRTEHAILAALPLWDAAFAVALAVVCARPGQRVRGSMR